MSPCDDIAAGRSAANRRSRRPSSVTVPFDSRGQVRVHRKATRLTPVSILVVVVILVHVLPTWLIVLQKGIEHFDCS